MNNKPVAYRHLHEDGWEYYDAPTSEDCKDCIPLYTHLAKTEEFVAGDAICPSCGCKSLYKTARSEWCVTHKCLWQKDYELTLTDEEILDFINAFCTDMGDYWDLNETNAIPMIRAILRKANEK